MADMWQAPRVKGNGCDARLGDRWCSVPRSNFRHMELPERHADGEGEWDDDAPGATLHPVTAEVQHYRKVVAQLRAHLVLGSHDDSGECIACAAEGFPGIPYPCRILTDAGVTRPAAREA